MALTQIVVLAGTMGSMGRESNSGYSRQAAECHSRKDRNISESSCDGCE